MLNRLIDLALRRPVLVVAGLLLLLVLGLHSLSTISIDAFPDLTNNQVNVVVDAPGMATLEVEQLVSFPVESALMGIPDTVEVRSLSKLGLSMITVVFEDHVDRYLARQLVGERLEAARQRIPEGLEPQLGPLATPFGEVFQYTVQSDGMSDLELKTLHDWEIKYQLRAVPGVADVVTWGGRTQQFEVVVDPEKLRAYSISLRQVYERIRDNNRNFSAGFVERAAEQYTVRGLGRAVTPREIESIVLESRGGSPVYVRDVARVRVGAVPRQGAVTTNGETETLAGMVIMLQGQNSKTIIERVEAELESVRSSLPEGVKIVPFYDQSIVIDGAIETVSENLLAGGALVVAVLFLSLGHFRAALLVALVIPLSLLSAFIGMRVFDVTANLMSLGAIDFGVVIDGAVVVVDNCVRMIDERRAQSEEPIDVLATVREAVHEVSTPVLAGLVIILAVYVPILTLEGLEGRMFRPMAIAVCAAMVGGAVLALFALPTGCRWLLSDRARTTVEPLFGPLRRGYVRVLGGALNHRVVVTVVAAVLIVAVLASLAVIGTEFMPRLDEGSILVQTFKAPSVSVSESAALNLELEKVLGEFPEVVQVVSKLGRPDFATEAMGVYETDTYLTLKPRDQWTTAATKEGLIDAMAAALDEFPGIGYVFTQPMAMRIDETVFGVRADVAVKIFGEDSDVLEDLADRIVGLLERVPGSADLQRQALSGAAEWQVDADREALARYGLNVEDVRETVEAATQGLVATEVIDGRRRFRAVVRLEEDSAQSLESLGGLYLEAPHGERVPLREVAALTQVSSPEVVFREESQRRLVVQSNVRGRDLGGFVQEARALVEANVDLPVGYYVRWGGQFENQERALARLSVLAPLILVGIFLILYSTFGSAGQASLVLLLAPFAAVGGTLALWLRDMNLNVSASIGFIAVFGIAILDGLVLVSAINRKAAEGGPLRTALIEAGKLRLRPVVMTSVVAALGFLPMALAQSTGAEVQRPLATVVIGGLVSSTLLTLVLMPVLYPWFARRRLF